MHKKKEIEENIIKFFHPIFTGHDLRKDGFDTGEPFVQDTKYLNYFFKHLPTLSDAEVAKLESLIS